MFLQRVAMRGSCSSSAFSLSRVLGTFLFGASPQFTLLGVLDCDPSCCKSVREFWTLTHVPWRRAFVGKRAGAPVLGEGTRTRGQSPLLVGSRRGAKRGRPPGGWASA